MTNRLDQLIGRYKDQARARLEKERQCSPATHCPNVAQLSSLVAHGDSVGQAELDHIRQCDRCRALCGSMLDGFPELPRPAWWPETVDCPTTSALVKRQTTALARKKDVAKINFRPWYLDHEGNDIRPWYMRWLDNLKDLPGDIFHTDREHRH